MGKLINYVQAAHWNYCTMLRKIKQDKEVRDKSCSLIGRLSIVRAEIFSKLTYRFPTIPINCPQSFLQKSAGWSKTSWKAKASWQCSEGSKTLAYWQVKKMVWHRSLHFHRQYLIPRSEIKKFISLSLPIPRYLSEINENINAHSNFIWSSGKQETTQTPISRWMGNCTVVYVRNKLHPTIDQSIEICNNMDEPQNNYVSKRKDK